MSFQRTRKLAPLISAGLIALGIAMPAHAANLLLNGSFEDPTPQPSEDQQATFWTILGTATRIGFAAHPGSGTRGMWMQTYTPQGAVTQAYNSISGGTNYSLSFWSFFEQPGFGNTGATYEAQLIWNTGPASQMQFSGASIPGGTWTQFTLNAMAPVGATAVTVSFDWFNGADNGGGQSVFLDDVDLEGAGPVPKANWKINGSGDWNLTGNWTTASVPNGVGAEALLSSAITSAHTIFSDTGITVGSLTFNNANTYVLAGAGSLSLQATGSASAVVNVQAGQQKINLPTFIKSNTTLNVSGGAGLRISDPMTINSGFVVTATGAGTVSYESIVNVLTGAGIAMRGGSHMAALNLTGTGAATLTQGANALLKMDSLAMDPNSTLDLNDNDAVVANGSYANISGRIRNARNGGILWNLPGITSGAARDNTQHNTTLGTLTGAEYHAAAGASAQFDGVDVSNTDILIKYTFYGDANFNGKVDGADYSHIDTTFNQEHSAGNIGGWANGDFNYDGKIDGADYGLIDSAFNSQSGTLRPALAIIGGTDPGVDISNYPSLAYVASHLEQFGQPYADAFLSAVPEPGTCLMFGLFGLLSQARVRRSKRR